jgi:phage gpG-like protein
VAFELRDAIVRGLQQGARIVKSYAVLNVGKIFSRGGSRLASSIQTRVTSRRNGGVLRVGTRVKYGAFWEYGFIHTGRGGPKLGGKFKFMTARPWLRPAAEQALPEISRLINLEVERELKRNFGKTITIDLKLT